VSVIFIIMLIFLRVESFWEKNWAGVSRGRGSGWCTGTVAANSAAAPRGGRGMVSLVLRLRAGELS
jgi:hypothetical protein